MLFSLNPCSSDISFEQGSTVYIAPNTIPTIPPPPPLQMWYFSPLPWYTKLHSSRTLFASNLVPFAFILPFLLQFPLHLLSLPSHFPLFCFPFHIFSFFPVGGGVFKFRHPWCELFSSWSWVQVLFKFIFSPLPCSPSWPLPSLSSFFTLLNKVTPFRLAFWRFRSSFRHYSWKFCASLLL